MATINIQPISKRRLRNDGLLEVHSVFNTIQGEGPFTGEQAVFIRLAGCNLQCPLCDTDYTSKSEDWHPSALLAEVKSFNTPAKLVIITGGEPFRQDIEELVLLLVGDGYRVQIETNGTLAPPSETFASLVQLDTTRDFGCFIVCSPKTGKVNAELQPLISAYKYVAVDAELSLADGLPFSALDHTASPCLARPHCGFHGRVYLQPCDEKDEIKNKKNLDACVKSVMEFGHTLQLQVHKLIEME